MTPQTPQGAALSDADIDKIALEVIYEGDTSIPYRQEWCNDIGRPFARAILAAADRRLTAEQGGAEPPKPFCHVVNMLEGLPENPSYIMLFDGQRFGNGFTHTALYTGEQLVAALTTQPPAEPVEDPIQERVLLRAAQPQAEPADAKDAARYRWLRDHSEPAICAFYLSVGKAFDGVKFARKTVDEAIDAQIATPTAPTEPT